MIDMKDQKHTNRYAIIAFSTAAAATAAIAGIAAYMFLVKRLAGDPTEILDRCQHAIDQIERDLAVAGR
jgi:hypothetical protein